MENREIVKHPRSKDRRDLKVDFCKMVLADKNVRTAISTCDALINIIMKWRGDVLPFEIAEAFIATIIVSYSRPFIQNTNSFPGKLGNKWHRFSSIELRETHQEMLNHRNSLFAHSDPDIHSVFIVPHAALPASIGPKPVQTNYEIKGIMIPPQNVTRYRAVCIDIQKRLEAEAQRLLSELYSGLELPSRKFPLKYDEGL